MSDATKTIGKILQATKGQERDAIHVAVLSVVCDEKHGLRQGAPVKLVYGTADRVRAAAGPWYGESGAGIVDPFLADYVKPGERFWMFLRPGTVTNLQHHWTHPDVDTPAVIKNAAEKWLRDFADQWHFDYDELIESASGQPDGDQYVVARGVDLHGREELGEDHDKFWLQLEALTGRTFDESHRDKFTWSCSC